MFFYENGINKVAEKKKKNLMKTPLGKSSA